MQMTFRSAALTISAIAVTIALIVAGSRFSPWAWMLRGSVVAGALVLVLWVIEDTRGIIERGKPVSRDTIRRIREGQKNEEEGKQ